MTSAAPHLERDEAREIHAEPWDHAEVLKLQARLALCVDYPADLCR